jgi:hypothetical protein
MLFLVDPGEGKGGDSMTIATLLFLGALGGPASVEISQVKPGEKLTIPLAGLKAGDYYGVVVSIPALSALGESEAVEVAISDPKSVLVSKTLHAGDPDLTATIRPRAAGAGKVEIVSRGSAMSLPIEVQSSRMDLSGKAGVLIACNPSPDWRSAQPIELGKPVFATADERPYIPLLGDPRRGLEDMLSGAQWFTFTWAGPREVLVHFQVDLLDRDVPVDVAVFQKAGEGAEAKLAPYTEGIERFIPERSTAFHGLYKFTPRVIHPGTYYLRVMGNHPAYQLRTSLYDPPPYDDPRQAVRAGMDYLVKKGDSWHANTPRRGHVVLRTSNPLQETSLCIACHPTHFTTRGELVAVENGYPVRERASLQFLTERLYNNPRPLYGFPDTSWVRMISAPGNVLSRLAYMEILFERNVSEEIRHGLLESIGNYLEKYWVDVKAPISESNGNAPRVSGYEVALHSSYVFEELYNRTREPKYLKLREQMDAVASAGEAIDMIDLSWKTVALATLDPRKHEKEIHDLVEKIFSQEREDGSWSLVLDQKLYGLDYTTGKRTESADFKKDEKGRPVSSEFQSWHCLYALAKAGVTDRDPRLKKAVQYCLSRQWSHGGWQGNSDFKNFDTPFRDTQYAIMALSELYKGPGSRGWLAGFGPMPEGFSDRADEALAALDQYWKHPGPVVVARIREALSHGAPLVRQAACAALGRIADADSAPRLAQALGDPSKLVRRAAAWALRQIMSRRGRGEELILAALRSGDDRTREGALRIFNQHFRYLAERADLSREVIERLQRDPVVLVRMEAAQALWRWWYWAKEEERKAAFETVVIDRLGAPEHPWVRRNLIEGLHNVLDENVSYLHNSWIRALVRKEDRERVSAGWRANVLGQAQRFRQALLGDSDLRKDGLLRSLYTFHLREAGGDASLVASVRIPDTFEGTWIDGYRQAITYDPLVMGSGVMAGIGNDHEPATFYEDSGPLMAEAIQAALDSPSEGLVTGGLKALRHTRGVPFTPKLAARLIALSGSAPAGARPEVLRSARELLPSQLPHTDEAAAALRSLLQSGEGDEIAGLVLREPRNAPFLEREDLQKAVGDRLLKLEGTEPGGPQLIAAAAASRRLAERAGVAGKLLKLSESGSPEAREAAIRGLLLNPRLLAAGPARKRFDETVASAGPERIGELLKTLQKTDWKKVEDEQPVSLALGIISVGLAHPSADARRAALEAVKSVERIQKNQGILAAVKSLAQSGEPPVRQAAEGLLLALVPKGGKGQRDLREPLDYGFFARKVQPILTRPAEDGDACVKCHANHVIFHLNRPEEVKDQEAGVRANYLSALKVVDLEKPDESLILVKPLQTFEKIGIPGEYRNSHGGNVRWAKGKEGEEYRAILQWVQGARLTEAVSAQPVHGPGSPPAVFGQRSF